MNKNTDFVWNEATQSTKELFETEFDLQKKQTDRFAVLPLVTGKIYYISSENGRKENDGTSPFAPTTIDRLYSTKRDTENPLPLRWGDTVLFECSSEFRDCIVMWDGVTYSSYGCGEKPVFRNSENASSPSQWVSVGNDVYRYTGKISKDDEVGNIAFDNGKAYGIKMLKLTSSYTCEEYINKTLALKNVSNGIDFYETAESYDFETGADLKYYDLSFYHDFENEDLYLYCKKGNPGDVFSSIEIAKTGMIFYADKSADVSVSNISFKNSGTFAIHTGGCENLSVENCDFSFIGGAIQFGYVTQGRNYHTRYGNAIENWGYCNGLKVNNCSFNNIYDAAITTQHSNAPMENISCKGNVFENVQYAFEMWTGDADGSYFKNMVIKNNYAKKLGEGISTGRPDKNVQSFLCTYGNFRITDCYVTGNVIFDCKGSVIHCVLSASNSFNGIVFDKNTYVHNINSLFGTFSATFPDFTPSGKQVTYTEENIKALHDNGFEPNGVFYYAY